MSNLYQARAAFSWTRPAGVEGVELVRVGVGTTVSVRPAPTPLRIAGFPHSTHRPSWRWTFKIDDLDYQAALQMTQGGSLDEMAARLGVSINTCKTQLQAAYAKTGTHRQADLLKLLLGLASR